jgi:hypothetical protein
LPLALLVFSSVRLAGLAALSFLKTFGASNMATVNITASSAKTTTGQSGAFNVSARDRLAVMADATAVSGAGASMTLSVEWSHDGTTFMPAETADTFTAITAATKRTKDFAVKASFMRLVWTISGTTPSFTFSAQLWLRDSGGRK